MFLRIEGITGKSIDTVSPDKGESQIEVLGWSWGVSGPPTSYLGTGSTQSGQPSFSDQAIVKFMDKASPPLFLRTASGQSVTKASLHMLKPIGNDGTPQQFFRIVFENVSISSLSQSASGGEDNPTEQLTFRYGKIKMFYREENPDGTLGSEISAGWDLMQNLQY
jgi:type VI secretion system secreted protein Hcp